MNLKTKTISFAIVSLLLMAHGFKLVHAFVAPGVYFEKVNLEKTSYSQGETVKGTALLRNDDSYVASDLHLMFKLEAESMPVLQYDRKETAEIFGLSPGEKIDKSFSYNLPANLPSGEFILSVRLANSKGEQLVWENQKITVQGNGSYLTVGNSWIGSGSQMLSPDQGAYHVQAGGTRFTFDVSNNSKISITGIPVATTYKRNAGREIVKSEKKSAVVFAPEGKENFVFDAPMVQNPGTYVTEAVMYDSTGTLVVSNAVSFLWIVDGEGYVQILYAGTDKVSYEPGDMAKIKVQYAGSAGNEIGGEKITMKIDIADTKGSAAGWEEEQVVLEGEGSQEVMVPVNISITNPKVKVRFFKGTEELDSYDFIAAGSTSKLKILTQSQVSNRYAIMGILLMIGLFMLGILLKSMVMQK